MNTLVRWIWFYYCRLFDWLQKLVLGWNGSDICWFPLFVWFLVQIILEPYLQKLWILFGFQHSLFIWTPQLSLPFLMVLSMLYPLNWWQLVPAWLSYLPIKGDLIEAKVVHDQLCSMVERWVLIQIPEYAWPIDSCLIMLLCFQFIFINSVFACVYTQFTGQMENF